MNYELIALKNQLSSLQVLYEKLRNKKKKNLMYNYAWQFQHYTI